MKKLIQSHKSQKHDILSSKGSFIVTPLSNTKIRKIESGFQQQLKVTRDSYLSKELEKYKNIEFIIEIK